MAITKDIIRKLEAKTFLESDYLVIPIMSTSEQTKNIKQAAARQGKRTIGIPLVSN